MKIHSGTVLLAIQNAFNSRFPHLRLEFYKKPHVEGEATSDREKLDPELKMSEVTRGLHTDELNFDGDMQVSGLEKLLDQQFGLYAQVFRRSANLWLQTTATDDWSLDMANRKGGHSERLYHEPSIDTEE